MAEEREEIAGRFKVSKRERESDFARLARSIECRFALGSLGFCSDRELEWPNRKGSRAKYGDARKNALEEGIIFSQRFEDFRVGGDVDEDGKGILRYRLWLVSHSAGRDGKSRASYTQRNLSLTASGL